MFTSSSSFLAAWSTTLSFSRVDFVGICITADVCYSSSIQCSCVVVVHPVGRQRRDAIVDDSKDDSPGADVLPDGRVGSAKECIVMMAVNENEGGETRRAYVSHGNR